ncbi:transposase [Prauserella halophila]|uniref:transposase n=1 Tax=Prauserella halophila TaxID=185641 RepID=UPI003CD0984D
MWAVIGRLFPTAKATGRPPVDRRTVVEATAWRFRTGAPCRDMPERFGNWNTSYKKFSEEPPDHAIGRSNGCSSPLEACLGADQQVRTAY